MIFKVMIETFRTQLRQLVFNCHHLSIIDQKAVLNIEWQFNKKGSLSTAQKKLLKKIYIKFQSVSVQRLRDDAEKKRKSSSPISNNKNWRDI